MKKALLVLSFICIGALPSCALAAGFAKDSLFLSRSPVTAGDNVRIYAIVANDDTTAFSGTVVLTDGSQIIDSVPVSIEAGGTQTASAPWTPTAGTHTITANLTSSTGTVVEEESASFTIAAPPTNTTSTSDTSQDAAAVSSSAPIQQDIADVSPQAASASQPLFTVLDSARSSAADILDSQIAATQTKLATTPKAGLVLGASTTADPIITNPWGTFWFVLYTIYLYILTILLWLVDNAGVFYPLLALLFFYGLWRTYRYFRRPRY